MNDFLRCLILQLAAEALMPPRNPDEAAALKTIRKIIRTGTMGDTMSRDKERDPKRRRMTKPEARRSKGGQNMKLNEWVVEVRDVDDKIIFYQPFQDFDEAQSLYLKMKEKNDVVESRTVRTVSLVKGERHILND